jgi:hypothetical protein
VEAAASIDHPFSRAEALRELAANLPPGLLAAAAEAAAAIDTPGSRARALIAIALAESRNHVKGDPRHWREALRAAAQVNRDSVVAVLPAVFAHVSPTIASQAAESVIRAQRWWP